MNKKIIRLLSLCFAFIIFASVFPSSVLKAEDDLSEDEVVINTKQLDKWIRDNYWVELEKVDTGYGRTDLVPKGADITNISFLKDLELNWAVNSLSSNVGIRTDRQGLYDVIDMNGVLDVRKNKLFYDWSDYIDKFEIIPDSLTKNGDQRAYLWKDGKINNPLNIDINNSTFAYINDFDMYGDLKNPKTNNTKSIDNLVIGENFNLDFNVNISMFTKYMNTYFLDITNMSGGLANAYLPDNGIILTDDIFVFTLDFPKEVDTSMMDLEIEGIEGLDRYTLKTEVISEDETGKKIRVTADENNEKDIVTIRDYLSYLNDISRFNGLLNLKIKNLKIKNDIVKSKNHTIKASFGGMYDYCITYKENKDELTTKDRNKRFKFIDHNGTELESYYNRNYFIFAAKQSNEGRDDAADRDKPNLISYTFNVEERKASHNPVVTFINDDRFYDEREVYEGTSINQNSYMPRDPEKRGYKFIEWNTMPDGSGMTFTGDTVVYEDMTVYAIYKKDRRYDDERETADEEPMLNINDHYQYMVGYKDATFRPNNNMTREEVAVMFSRLMVRRPIKGHIYNHNFKDLSNTRWSATAISYMNELGLIKGYPDGTFKPEKSITRAEFAAMATRFANLFGGGLQGFVDVPYTHWANDVIAKAASAGWVSGYPDGTFKPENKITRAEVVSITNRMLTRRADKDFITKHRSAILWFTDTPTHWAFYDIAEACNGHDYTRQGTIEENWLNVNLKTFVYDK